MTRKKSGIQRLFVSMWMWNSGMNMRLRNWFKSLVRGRKPNIVDDDLDMLIQSRDIETEHLIIRPYRHEDAEMCFRNIFNDESLNHFLDWCYCYDVEETDGLMSSCCTDNWVFVLKENNEIIGNVTLDRIPYPHVDNFKMGWIAGKEYRGKGLMYEGLKELIYSYFEGNLGVCVDSIEVSINDHNIPSLKLADRLGFELEGVMKDRRIDYVTGEKCSLKVGSITKDRWDYYMHMSFEDYIDSEYDDPEEAAAILRVAETPPEEFLREIRYQKFMPSRIYNFYEEPLDLSDGGIPF